MVRSLRDAWPCTRNLVVSSREITPVYPCCYNTVSGPYKVQHRDCLSSLSRFRFFALFVLTHFSKLWMEDLGAIVCCSYTIGALDCLVSVRQGNPLFVFTLHNTRYIYRCVLQSTNSSTDCQLRIRSRYQCECYVVAAFATWPQKGDAVGSSVLLEWMANTSHRCSSLFPFPKIPLLQSTDLALFTALCPSFANLTAISKCNQSLHEHDLWLHVAYFWLIHHQIWSCCFT